MAHQTASHVSSQIPDEMHNSSWQLQPKCRCSLWCCDRLLEIEAHKSPWFAVPLVLDTSGAYLAVLSVPSIMSSSPSSCCIVAHSMRMSCCSTALMSYTLIWSKVVTNMEYKWSLVGAYDLLSLQVYFQLSNPAAIVASQTPATSGCTGRQPLSCCILDAHCLLQPQSLRAQLLESVTQVRTSRWPASGLGVAYFCGLAVS